MTWTDEYSGKRGHALMTKEVGNTIPPLYTNEDASEDEVVVQAKLFSPYSNWTWYITEWDGDSGLCFGLVDGFATELGYFDLTELSEVTLFKGLPAIERDLYWNRQTLAEVRKQIYETAHS